MQPCFNHRGSTDFKFSCILTKYKTLFVNISFEIIEIKKLKNTRYWKHPVEGVVLHSNTIMNNIQIIGAHEFRFLDISFGKLGTLFMRLLKCIIILHIRKSNWSGEHPGFRVPDSCCKTESPGCGVRDHPSNIPYTGCIHTFSAQLTDHLVLLGVVSLALALLQIFGVIFTACLFSRYVVDFSQLSFHNYLQQ